MVVGEFNNLNEKLEGEKKKELKRQETQASSKNKTNNRKILIMVKGK
jgi:hypothetical protein